MVVEFCICIKKKRFIKNNGVHLEQKQNLLFLMRGNKKKHIANFPSLKNTSQTQLEFPYLHALTVALQTTC